MLTLLLNRHAWWTEAGRTEEAVHMDHCSEGQNSRTYHWIVEFFFSSYSPPPFLFILLGGWVGGCVCGFFCFSGRLGKW